VLGEVGLESPEVAEVLSACPGCRRAAARGRRGRGGAVAVRADRLRARSRGRRAGHRFRVRLANRRGLRQRL